MDNNERSAYGVFNEVIKSSYPTLAGLLANLEYDDSEFELYCQRIRKALWQEKRFYYELSDSQIVEVSKILSPIIKTIVSDNTQAKAMIISNKNYFDSIIVKHNL
jgi:hypothetical protein